MKIKCVMVLDTDKQIEEIVENKESSITISDTSIADILKVDIDVLTDNYKITDVYLYLSCYRGLIEVKDYSLTKKIKFYSLYNVETNFAYFKCHNVDLVINGYEIKSLELENSGLDLERSKVGSLIYNKSLYGLADADRLSSYDKKSINITSSEVNNIVIHSSVSHLLIGACVINRLSILKPMHVDISPSNIFMLTIYNDTQINKAKLDGNIEQLDIYFSDIKHLSCTKRTIIKKLKHTDCHINYSVGFDQNNILDGDRPKWVLIRDSACNSKNSSLRAIAAYEIETIDHKNQNPFAKFFFNRSIGYGYKPWRMLTFIPIVILVFALLYVSLYSANYLLEGNSILCTNEGWDRFLKICLDRIYHSGITLTTLGYNDVEPILSVDVLLHIGRFLAVVESSIGVILYSLFGIAIVKTNLEKD